MKWHLVSRAAGETDITLDDFVTKLDPATVDEGTKLAQPWLDAQKQKQAAEAQRAKQMQAGPQGEPAQQGLQPRGEEKNGK